MHRPHLRLLLPLVLSAATFPLTGCLFRTRTIDRQLSNSPLQTATQQDLIDYVNNQAAKIQSMQATVDIDASAGDMKNGKITDYKEIRGYVLARKPAMLRMKGLLPVVRNTAFDMVSDGQAFKLWIPTKNKFVIGPSNSSSTAPTINASATPERPQSNQRLENMRPQYIYDALLMPELSADEIPFSENGHEIVLDAKRHRVEQPDYELAVLRKGQQGWYLSRRIEFSRTDLLPHRQRIYDLQGNVVTDVRYQDYKDFGGTMFPGTIEIERPREDYDIILNIVKLEINKPLTDDQFALEQPPGAEVVRLDQPNSSVAKAPDGKGR
jgi:outer membrane lipoprotein-sorting protein